MPTATKLSIAVSGIPTALATRIRQDLVDDYGNQLTVRRLDEPVPCRHCLRLTVPGEQGILFAYSPFEMKGPYSEVGPVYIHAHACAPYAATDALPADFIDKPRLFRAYNAAGAIVDAAIAASGDHPEVVGDFLNRREVAFVHTRSPGYGCFTYRITRGDN